MAKIETESVILSAPAATVRFEMPRGWKWEVREDEDDEWVADSPNDTHSLYIKFEPVPALAEPTPYAQCAHLLLERARRWNEGPNSEFRVEDGGGILRYYGHHQGEEAGLLLRFFIVGRIFDRGEAGARSIRLILVCPETFANTAETAALVQHLEAEIERVAGCVANWACLTADDVVFHKVEGNTRGARWVGRVPLDWSFDEDEQGHWWIVSPGGEHVLNAMASFALAPGMDETDSFEDQLTALLATTTRTLRATDLEGDVEILRQNGDPTVVVHGCFFADEPGGRKLVRRWYGFTPVGEKVGMLQFNYVVPATRGRDPDVLAHAEFFARQLHVIDAEDQPRPQLN